MESSEKEYTMDEIIKENISMKNMHHKINEDIYLSENQMQILTLFKIDYQKYSNIKQLMYAIEEYLDEEENDELEQILIDISEFNYYHNTRK